MIDTYFALTGVLTFIIIFQLFVIVRMRNKWEQHAKDWNNHADRIGLVILILLAPALSPAQSVADHEGAFYEWVPGGTVDTIPVMHFGRPATSRPDILAVVQAQCPFYTSTSARVYLRGNRTPVDAAKVRCGSDGPVRYVHHGQVIPREDVLIEICKPRSE